jgi:hypothetical protein
VKEEFDKLRNKNYISKQIRKLDNNLYIIFFSFENGANEKKTQHAKHNSIQLKLHWKFTDLLPELRLKHSKITRQVQIKHLLVNI